MDMTSLRGWPFLFLAADQPRNNALSCVTSACPGLWQRSLVVFEDQGGLPVSGSWQQPATPLQPSLPGHWNVWSSVRDKPGIHTLEAVQLLEC